MATTQESLSTLLADELSVAATKAALTSTGKSRQVRLTDSDLPSLVPSGAYLKVKSVKLSDLKMGDLICIQVGSRLAVRRFVKLKITSARTLLLVAKEGSNQKEEMSHRTLLGKVEAANAGGQTYDPLQTEGALQKFWGMLTEYGTHRPFGLKVA